MENKKELLIVNMICIYIILIAIFIRLGITSNPFTYEDVQLFAITGLAGSFSFVITNLYNEH
jgi:fluoride ion exporter CrcB/FEX